MDYLNHDYQERDHGVVVYYADVRGVDDRAVRKIRKDYYRKSEPQFYQFLAANHQPALKQAGVDDEQINAMAQGISPDRVWLEDDPWRVLSVVDKRVSGLLENPNAHGNLCLVRESAAQAFRTFSGLQMDPFGLHETRNMMHARPAGYVYPGNSDHVMNALAQDRYMAVLESSHEDLRLKPVTVTKQAMGWGAFNENDKAEWLYWRAEFLELTTGTFPRTMERFGVDGIALRALNGNHVATACNRLPTNPKVHHIKPLRYGGTHDFGNLSLMLDDEAEQVLHEKIDEQTDHWRVGETGVIMLPVPPRPFCAWSAKQMRAEIRAIELKVVPIFGGSPVPSRERPSIPGEHIEKAAYLPRQFVARNPLDLNPRDRR